MTCGVYCIKNTKNGHCYIGSAICAEERWKVHLRTLRRGKHQNSHLQRAFDKHGEAVFTFGMLEEVNEPSLLIAREQAHMDAIKPEYNICRVAGSNLGVKYSLEARMKMSAAGKRRRHSAETCLKISIAKKGQGHKQTAETCMKLSIALTGHKHSAETRMKIGAAGKGNQYRKGYKASAETCAKMSIASKGNDHAKGRKSSAETRAKLSDAAKRRYANARGREELSEARKQAWAEGKYDHLRRNKA
jgi:group I intron endonuclease